MKWRSANDSVCGAWFHSINEATPPARNRWGLVASYPDTIEKRGTVTSLSTDIRDRHRGWNRVQLLVLAGVIVSVIWELDGSGEVAIAAAALTLQVIEMTSPDHA